MHNDHNPLAESPLVVSPATSSPASTPSARPSSPSKYSVDGPTRVGLGELRRQSVVFQSFENLVVLANYQERLRDARRIIWRGRGEPVEELEDLWECTQHAARGGMRAAAMGLAIRASVNLVLALVRLKSVPNSARLRLIQHALFGADTFRFGAMLGSFVGIYKYLINALPLVFPTTLERKLPRFRVDEDIPTGAATPVDGPLMMQAPYERHLTQQPKPLQQLQQPQGKQRRLATLSLSAEAHEILVRKKTSRWHSVIAGAVAGALAVLWEKRSRRVTIAQQMFVRGLQGTYNVFADRHNIRIPGGEVLLFGFACAQILYAFTLNSDTLPRSYYGWLMQAGKMPSASVRMNGRLVRDGIFNPADLQYIIDLKDTTARNRTILEERLLRATAASDFGPRYAPCAAIHPSVDSCLVVLPVRFLEVFRWMLPIYGTLHLVPTILVKRGDFMRRPWRLLLRAALGTARSSSFLGLLVAIYYAWFCGKHNLHAALSAAPTTSAFKIPQRIVDVLVHKGSFALGGFFSGLSVLAEERRRRSELAMYVLPRSLESAWAMARGRGWVFKTGEFGETILTAVGMGMVMSIYQNDPQHLSGLVRRILYQFVGPN